MKSGSAPIDTYGSSANGVGEELTATIQYNLWANVISRVEFRWDHADSHPYPFGVVSEESGNGVEDSFILALNVIYTF